MKCPRCKTGEMEQIRVCDDYYNPTDGHTEYPYWMLMCDKCEYYQELDHDQD